MSEPLETRICEDTGLALVSSPVSSHRVSGRAYGPLNPIERKPSDRRENWSRWDTVGKTIYTADSKQTAYLELFAPFRTRRPDNSGALQKTAESMGISLEDFWSSVKHDWQAAGNMHATLLPQSWREKRLLYTLRFPQGWWIDINAAESIAAITNQFQNGFPDQTKEIAEFLTLSDITGDDRLLTTTLSSMLRDRVQFDDGTIPLGIRFLSKHGNPSGQSGHCWAHWLRPKEPITYALPVIIESSEILARDLNFLAASKLFNIKSC